jgi:sulfur relay (sulfurtransferase) complex TusBCD TusD component (DsrE family)
MYKRIRSTFTLILGIVAVGLFQPVNADWLIDSGGGISQGDAQDIVISLKANPMSHLEQACLAVTFARSLSGGANVTLFVTLDGVSLADKKDAVFSDNFVCTTPWGKITLKENLETFLDKNDDNMVVCPICWKERYADKTQPIYGVLPGITPNVPGTAIGKMMLDADKILDF